MWTAGVGGADGQDQRLMHEEPRELTDERGGRVMAKHACIKDSHHSERDADIVS